MRLFVLSRDRWDYRPTMSTMPKSVKKMTTVMVPKDQLKQYDQSPIFHGAKIKAWPSYVDCVPKKRRFLYENVPGHYLLLDDDMGLVQWNRETKTFMPAMEDEKAYMKKLERMWSRFDTHVAVGAAGTFMTSKNIKETGKTTFDKPTCCFSGFSDKRPKIQWKTFFFTDIMIPVQIMAKNHKVITDANLAYAMRDNKKLQTTATALYRSDAVVKYSALAAAQTIPGYIFGLKHTGSTTGGWSLQKTYTRPNKDRSNEWIEAFMAENKLLSLPKQVELDLKTPMADLFKAYAQSWKKARQ